MSNVAYADFAARTAAEQQDGEPEDRFHPVVPECTEAVWAKDVYLRTLWENLLLTAARQPYTANFKGRQWPLQTGQLVTTTADLGLDLCDRNGEPTSRHAVDRMLAFFEKEGMIATAGERRKGTVITITNYALYAQKWTIYPRITPRITASISPRITNPVTARLRRVVPRITPSIRARLSPRIMNKK